MASVNAVVLVSVMSTMHRRALMTTGCTALVLLLAACGSDAGDQAQDAVDQAQVAVVTSTSVPTTAPLSLPTSTATPVPAPTPSPTEAALPQAAPTSVPTPLPTQPPTPVPAPLPVETSAAVAPTAVPAPDPATAATAVPVPTAAATAVAAEPTAVATVAAEPDAEETPTSVVETPTPVVAAASGDAPIECFDRDLGFPRAYIEGVDNLSFDGGTVYCTGSARDEVSVARSYRHANGLVIQRNADFIFNDTSSTYIPYSGAVHFCLNGQPGSAPVRADSVPALLVVIDNEAQRQVASGASAPAAFTGSGAQC